MAEHALNGIESKDGDAINFRRAREPGSGAARAVVSFVSRW
jgi:hypothetical protein